MAKRKSRASKLLMPPSWEPYEVALLVKRLLETWESHCRTRNQLEEGSLRESPSQMYAAYSNTPALEMTRSLVDVALKAVGPVRYEGRLFETERSAFETPVSADKSVQDAFGLFVEIRSPINGQTRRVWREH